MIILIIPFFRTSKLMTEVMVVEEVEKPVFHWKWLAVAIVCLVLIRILLR
jgi:hypothetical protein